MAARILVLLEQEASLKAEARALLDKAAAEGNRALTADEAARCDAIEAALDALKPELAREQRFQDTVREIPASQVIVGTDRATARPWGPAVPTGAGEAIVREARLAALGEWGMAVRAAAMGRNFDPRLFAAASGMNSSVPSEGGFAVPQEIAPGIERDMFAGGQILSRVDARTVSGDSIAYNVIDETSRASTRAGGILGYWVDQGTSPTATKPKLARMELKLRKVGCLGYMTDELVSDAAALGGELQALFVDELTFQVEDAIFRGTGAGQPLGFTVAPCLVTVAKETGQVAATIVSTNLSKMWARLPARSKANAVWLINVDCEPQLDELTLPAGTAGLQPRFVNYNNEGILTIKGRPVIPVEYCTTLGQQNDIVLVDLTRYRLIRKAGVEQASSIHVLFTTGEQTFRAFYRVDGQPVPRSALTPFKGANDLSPFVTLAIRS